MFTNAAVLHPLQALMRDLRLEDPAELEEASWGTVQLGVVARPPASAAGQVTAITTCIDAL